MTESLEQRIDRLESIQEITQLKYAYCAACDDDHNGPAVANLFVPNGVWDAGAGIGRAEGTEAITKLMMAIRDGGSMRNSAHQVFNPRINIEGDIATAHWRLLMMYTANTDNMSERFRRVVGYYDETYVRVDGTWKYQELICTVQENSAYMANETPLWADMATTPGTRLPV